MTINWMNGKSASSFIETGLRLKRQNESDMNAKLFIFNRMSFVSTWLGNP